MSKLCFIGDYSRRIPVSLNRMIENAYDWEHLPFIHSSTFHDIELIAEGAWGWRAKVRSAKSKGSETSLLELLVDAEKHYWATTVVQGVGEGVEIHTQATQLSEREIEVDVRFYLPKTVNWLSKKLAFWYLRRQYRNLYDEDAALMRDRQSAIDDQRRWRELTSPSGDRMLVGKLEQLDLGKTRVVEAARGRICVSHHNGQWRAYSAVCPHQLGKLDDAKIQSQGEIVCPWHGYRFDISNGENLDRKCTALTLFKTEIEDDSLFVRLK